MFDNEKIMEVALRLLDFQDRTIEELREKLNKKGFNKKGVDEVIAYLQESDILNDRRYAEIFASGRFASGKGRTWIRNKLMTKGISREVIDEAISTVSEDIDERLLCYEKALSICSLSDIFEVTSDGEIIPTESIFLDNFGENSKSDFSYMDREPVRYFYRNISQGERDRQLIYKEHEKAKASLTRKLISAGYPSGIVFEVVRKIDDL